MDGIQQLLAAWQESEREEHDKCDGWIATFGIEIAGGMIAGWLEERRERTLKSADIGIRRASDTIRGGYCAGLRGPRSDAREFANSLSFWGLEDLAHRDGGVKACLSAATFGIRECFSEESGGYSHSQRWMEADAGGWRERGATLFDLDCARVHGDAAERIQLALFSDGSAAVRMTGFCDIPPAPHGILLPAGIDWNVDAVNAVGYLAAAHSVRCPGGMHGFSGEGRARAAKTEAKERRDWMAGRRNPGVNGWGPDSGVRWTERLSDFVADAANADMLYALLGDADMPAIPSHADAVADALRAMCARRR